MYKNHKKSEEILTDPKITACSVKKFLERGLKNKKVAEELGISKKLES